MQTNCDPVELPLPAVSPPTNEKATMTQSWDVGEGYHQGRPGSARPTSARPASARPVSAMSRTSYEDELEALHGEGFFMPYNEYFQRVAGPRVVPIEKMSHGIPSELAMRQRYQYYGHREPGPPT